jgi:hypothetical protein
MRPRKLSRHRCAAVWTEHERHWISDGTLDALAVRGKGDMHLQEESDIARSDSSEKPDEHELACGRGPRNSVRDGERVWKRRLQHDDGDE